MYDLFYNFIVPGEYIDNYITMGAVVFTILISIVLLDIFINSLFSFCKIGGRRNKD